MNDVDQLSMKTPEDLFEIFSQLNIAVTTSTHEAVFTVTSADLHKTYIPGAHSKNLFLKSKKGVYYLVSMLDDKRLNLKIFAKELGVGSLSFACEEDLIAQLGVEPGHVTPFGLINAFGNNIQVILDKEMMEYELLNFHPLKNHMTTTIPRQGLLKFIEFLGFEPLILTLPKLV